MVLERMEGEGGGFCVVVDEREVVLGLLEVSERQRASPEVTAAEVMRPGPTTVRANEPLQALVERMKRASVGGVPVTDPEGRLLGFLVRQDGENAPGGDGLGRRRPWPPEGAARALERGASSALPWSTT